VNGMDLAVPALSKLLKAGSAEVKNQGWAASG
jgi:hypothetical protein